ncbi:MAG: PDZ domain-containing protein [Actinobacteria bacterium]|nr:PDZ domain-containing protein [Actinomycetota bacterium]
MENYNGQYYQEPVPPQAPSPGGKASRKGWIFLGIAVAIIVIGSLIVGGLFLDKVLFNKEESKDFVLEDSSSYQDALYDIKRYFYYNYSEAKITEAAEKAVEKAKKKGETSSKELLNIGLDALTRALDDQHSSYLSPEENKRLSDDLSGSFFGVGFTLRDEEGRPKVVSVIEGSPSEKAGVKEGDIIMAVDGKDTKDQGLNNVVLWIRGERGTEVTLDVKRTGEDKELSFTMTREKIEIPDFESEMMDGNIGYINLIEFNEGAGEKVRKAVRELEDQGARGFILDLRNDPGGLLDEAVNVVSVFVNGGEVVSYEAKGRDKVVLNAEGSAETDLPLVVLVNGGSASSSEIVAGALRDRERATLVGSTTYGKGSVQKIFDLPNGGAAKLTVSLYYLPKGETIGNEGITPEILVENKDDPEAEDQLQLDKAKEVLNNLIQGKGPEGKALYMAA